jgi:hypothetical protein
MSRSKKTESTEQARTWRSRNQTAGPAPEALPTTPKQEPRLAEAEREPIARKARKEDKKEASHEER